jgi:4-hydroxybenzoate polyprenyltransferase
MSSSGQLTLESPLAQRLLAWSGERFPVANGVLIFVIYASALLYGRALTNGGEVSLSLSDLAGFVAVWAYFLILRVFDEHKDYERDSHTHPERVLQSGLVTLGHLRALGWAAVAVQLSVSVLMDGGLGPVTALWALTMGWTLLMLKEFFVGEWLARRLLLYAFTHMLSMPLAFLWMAQMGAGDIGLPAEVIWIALLGGLIGASLEVGRKLRAPEDERPGVDSYTKVLGTTGAPALAGVLLTAAVAAGAGLLGAAGDASAAACLALAFAAAPGIGGAATFARRPTGASAKRAEALVGVSLLLLPLVLIVALLAERGVA